MKFPPDAAGLLANRFRTRRLRWTEEALRRITGNLRPRDGDGSQPPSDWPMTVKLDAPTGLAAASEWSRFEEFVRAWARSAETLPGQVVFERREMRGIGSQTVPAALILKNPQEAAARVGHDMLALWQKVMRRGHAIVLRFPGIEAEAARHWEVLADWEEDDFTRLLSVLDWFEANRHSGLFIRQLPVENVDTKWYTAGRQKVIVALLSAVRRLAGEDVPEKTDFVSFCELRPLPSSLIRVRLLDERLRERAGGMEDFSATADELAKLPVRPETVFISENRDSGLAFEDMPDAAVIFGLGNNLAGLETLPWVRSADVVYWGDIDTYGFRILSEARRRLPQIRSVMMDMPTLARFADLSVLERRQADEDTLENLTAAETEVFHALTHNRIGFHMRIEQERIPWPYARAVLAEAAGTKAEPSESIVRSKENPT